MFGISISPLLPSLGRSGTEAVVNSVIDGVKNPSIDTSTWGNDGSVYDALTGNRLGSTSSNSAPTEDRKDYGTALSDDMLNFESDEAQLARDFSAEEAAKQRDWLEKMSNSAYSRAVADIKSAGLNPYMMYGNGGFQASTPAGASAQTVKANAVNNTADAMLISAVINGVANVVGSVLNFAKPGASITKIYN